MAIDYQFIINLITTIILLITSIEIARRWKRRKMLAIEFGISGISYFLFYISSFYWSLYGNLYVLVAAAIFSILWSSFLSNAILRMLYSPKKPLNWLLIAFLFIPVIYIFTGSIEMTSFQTVALSILVTFCSFFLVTAIGKEKMKVYGVSGMIASLVGILSIFVFIGGGMILNLWFIINLLLVFSFAGFWRTSSKRPKNFIADYDGKKDGR